MIIGYTTFYFWKPFWGGSHHPIFFYCKKDSHFSSFKGFPFFHENTFHSRSVRGSRWIWPNPFDSRTSDLANFLSLSHHKISFQGFLVSQHESGKTSSQIYKGLSFLSMNQRDFFLKASNMCFFGGHPNFENWVTSL